MSRFCCCGLRTPERMLVREAQVRLLDRVGEDRVEETGQRQPPAAPLAPGRRRRAWPRACSMASVVAAEQPEDARRAAALEREPERFAPAAMSDGTRFRWRGRSRRRAGVRDRCRWPSARRSRRPRFAPRRTRRWPCPHRPERRRRRGSCRSRRRADLRGMPHARVRPSGWRRGLAVDPVDLLEPRRARQPRPRRATRPPATPRGTGAGRPPCRRPDGARVGGLGGGLRPRMWAVVGSLRTPEGVGRGAWPGPGRVSRARSVRAPDGVRRRTVRRRSASRTGRLGVLDRGRRIDERDERRARHGVVHPAAASSAAVALACRAVARRSAAACVARARPGARRASDPAPPRSGMPTSARRSASPRGVADGASDCGPVRTFVRRSDASRRGRAVHVAAIGGSAAGRLGADGHEGIVGQGRGPAARDRVLGDGQADLASCRGPGPDDLDEGSAAGHAEDEADGQEHELADGHAARISRVMLPRAWRL